MKKESAVVPANEPKKDQVQIIHEKDLTRLTVLGEELKAAVLATGEKYLNLCKHIREKQIPPVIVRENLLKLGFAKTRVSEINRVAQCGDEVWNEFEARSLSFRKVLQLERGEIENLGGEPAQVGPSGSVVSDGASVSEGGDEGEVSLEDRKQQAQDRMLRSAKSILHAAADLELRAKKWTIGNGYELRLVKDKTHGKLKSSPIGKAKGATSGE